MERSIDDNSGFINKNIGSVLELSSSIGLLVRQDGSLYESNAAKEDHKQDIIALCFIHLKLWFKEKENSINYDIYLMYEDWLVPTAKVICCNFITSVAGQIFKR
jgi:hypothetical protein